MNYSDLVHQAKFESLVELLIDPVLIQLKHGIDR